MFWLLALPWLLSVVSDTDLSYFSMRLCDAYLMTTKSRQLSCSVLRIMYKNMKLDMSLKYGYMYKLCVKYCFSVSGTKYFDGMKIWGYVWPTDFMKVEEIQRDATVCRYLFTAKLHYMFRASIAPIIRSKQNCSCSLCYRSYCKVQKLN